MSSSSWIVFASAVCIGGVLSFQSESFLMHSRPQPRRHQQRFQGATSSSLFDNNNSNNNGDSDSSLFDWTTEWYPLAAEQDLFRDAPNKLTLLGMDLVVWYNNNDDDPSHEQWQAFVDVCPHRLVPLSEGRIEYTLQGNAVLQCAYHGWEFNATGQCVSIPQITSPQQQAAAQQNPRARVTSFPTRVEQGLLWVFATPDPLVALTKQPALIAELHEPTNKVDATMFYTRDLPYSWDVLVENLADPSHVSFSHHGMMNNANRYNVDPMNFQLVQASKVQIKAQKDLSATTGSGHKTCDFTFSPPCLLYTTISTPTSFLGLGTYCIPTGPGQCRLITRFPFSLPIPPVMWLLKHTPRWINHFSQNIVLDSDMVFLATQDEFLRRQQQQQQQQQQQAATTTSTRSKYYLPAASDTMVASFRQWMKQYAPHGPTMMGVPAQRSGNHASADPTTAWNRAWHRVPQPPLGRDALLDRYHQHTEVCAACRTAHWNLYRLREVCGGMGVALVAGAAGGLWERLFVKQQQAALATMTSAIVGAILLVVPRLILRPLIARLECVPWPRKSWRKPTTSTGGSSSKPSFLSKSS